MVELDVDEFQIMPQFYLHAFCVGCSQIGAAARGKASPCNSPTTEYIPQNTCNRPAFFGGVLILLH